ncbi:beta carbonic anhydrase 1-like [Tubulanus polymorphus]|uniref:beta carbonic anhydrase 1-like n=1 Tax=Tubulanus polymorphus TaxID=672921 RepID=UPI003DA59505
MEKILKGILRYRQTYKAGMVKQFEKIRDNPQPKALAFCCMDSRVLPTRFTQTDVGDMFLVRNAGNLVPHHKHHGYTHITTEPAALELACVIGGIKHVIVCGHSDCKAMNALYGLRETAHIHEGTPLQLWLKKHATSSLEKLEKLEQIGSREPLVFQGESDKHTLNAFIDPENQFAITDKLSMINTLQQIQNISSHPFLADGLINETVRLHAMWFDIYTGDVYLFNRPHQRFMVVDENSVDEVFLKDQMLVGE